MEMRKEIRVTADDTALVFSNATQVSVSDNSVVLHFAYVRPNAPSGKLLTEIVLSPRHAINFSRALDTTIKKHFTRHLNEQIEPGVSPK